MEEIILYLYGMLRQVWADLGLKKKRTHPIFKAVEDACMLWWTEKRDQYTLEDFFTYGKHNDLTFKFRDFRELIIP